MDKPNKSEQVSTAVVVATLEKLAAPVMRKVTDLKIKTKEDFELAANLVKKLKEWSKEASEQESKIINPMKEAMKAAQLHFKPFRNRVAEIELFTKSQMDLFLSNQEAKLKQLEANFSTGKIKKVSTLLASQDSLRVDNGAAQIRKVWKVNIIDAKKIPREFLIPDEVAIRESCKSGKVPAGCEWRQENTIAI